LALLQPSPRSFVLAITEQELPMGLAWSPTLLFFWAQRCKMRNASSSSSSGESAIASSSFTGDAVLPSSSSGGRHTSFSSSSFSLSSSSSFSFSSLRCGTLHPPLLPGNRLLHLLRPPVTRSCPPLLLGAGIRHFLLFLFVDYTIVFLFGFQMHRFWFVVSWFMVLCWMCLLLVG